MKGESTALWPDFPFCSSRCKLIDLGRWLGDRYNIAAREDPMEIDEESDDSE